MIIDTPESAKALAYEAYVYGFAIVENYKAILVSASGRIHPRMEGSTPTFMGESCLTPVSIPW